MGEMTEDEAKELLQELLRASLQEAMDAALQSLGGKVHNTPEGRRLLSEALSKQLAQRGLSLGQVFELPTLVSMRAGYEVEHG